MSIARAFTLRHKRTESPPSSPPANGTPTPSVEALKRMGSVIDRNKISGPIELISTTNMLSYNAPDVATLRMMRQTSSASSSTSSNSGHESDSSSPTRSSDELTDASSVNSSPTSPEPNHLSCYFKSAQDDATKKPRRSVSTANFHRKSLSDTNAPAIPQRSLTHSKSAHLQLARKRSMQSVSSSSSGKSTPSLHSQKAPSIREPSRETMDFFKGTVEPNHPFGKELEKLSEVAEEIGSAVRDAETNEDAVIMSEKGLLKFTADEYLMELRPLYQSAFGRNHPTALSPASAWI